MTPVEVVEAPQGTGRLAKLMAAVRPEFRVDMLVPQPDDPILGGGACRVAGCDRARRSRGLCVGHFLRWRSQGKPDLEQFRSTTSPGLLGRAPLRPCTAPGCRFARHSHGLCDRHDRAWQRAGRPDRTAWLATLMAMDPSGRRRCRVSFCDLWAQGHQPFCSSHARRWRTAGRPDLEQFVSECEDYGRPRLGVARSQGLVELGCCGLAA